MMSFAFPGRVEQRTVSPGTVVSFSTGPLGRMLSPHFPASEVLVVQHTLHCRVTHQLAWLHVSALPLS